MGFLSWLINLYKKYTFWMIMATLLLGIITFVTFGTILILVLLIMYKKWYDEDKKVRESLKGKEEIGYEEARQERLKKEEEEKKKKKMEEEKIKGDIKSEVSEIFGRVQTDISEEEKEEKLKKEGIVMAQKFKREEEMKMKEKERRQKKSGVYKSKIKIPPVKTIVKRKYKPSQREYTELNGIKRIEKIY